MYRVLRHGFTLYGACAETEKRFIIPSGLSELIADISRKVLQNQPGDIITFIAEFLEAQLEARNVIDDADKLMEETLYEAQEQLLFNFKDYGIDEAKATEAATRIQSAFRGYRVRKDMDLTLKSSSFLILSPTDSDASVETGVHKAIELGTLPEEHSAIILYKRTKSHVGRAPCITLKSEYLREKCEIEATFEGDETPMTVLSSEAEAQFLSKQRDFELDQDSGQIKYQQNFDDYKKSRASDERKAEHSTDEESYRTSMKSVTSVRQESDSIKEFIHEEADKISLKRGPSHESDRSRRMSGESRRSILKEKSLSVKEAPYDAVKVSEDTTQQVLRELTHEQAKVGSTSSKRSSLRKEQRESLVSQTSQLDTESSALVKQKPQKAFDEVKQRKESRVNSIDKQAIQRDSMGDEKSVEGGLKDHKKEERMSDRISDASIRLTMQSKDNTFYEDLKSHEKDRPGSVASKRPDLKYDDIEKDEFRRASQVPRPCSRKSEKIYVGDLVLGSIIQPPGKTKGEVPCVKICTGIQTEKEVSETHDRLKSKEILTPEEAACQHIASLVRQRILDYKYCKIPLDKYSKVLSPQHYELDQVSEQILQQQSFEEFLRNRIDQGALTCPPSDHSLNEDFEQSDVLLTQSYVPGEEESFKDIETLQRFRLKQICKDIRDGKLKTDLSSKEDSTQEQDYDAKHFSDLKVPKAMKVDRKSQKIDQDKSSREDGTHKYDIDTSQDLEDMSGASKIQEENVFSDLKEEKTEIQEINDDLSDLKEGKTEIQKIHGDLSDLKDEPKPVKSSQEHVSDSLNGLPEHEKTKDSKKDIKKKQLKPEGVVAPKHRGVCQVKNDEMLPQIKPASIHRLLRAGRLHLIKREEFCEVGKIDPSSNISEMDRLDAENRQVVQQAILDVLLEQIKNGEISESMLAKLITAGLISKELAGLIASGEMSDEERDKLVTEMMKALQEGTLDGNNVFDELGDILFKGPDGMKLKEQLEIIALEGEYDISGQDSDKYKTDSHKALHKDGQNIIEKTKVTQNQSFRQSTSEISAGKELKSQQYIDIQIHSGETSQRTSKNIKEQIDSKETRFTNVDLTENIDKKHEDEFPERLSDQTGRAETITSEKVIPERVLLMKERVFCKPKKTDQDELNIHNEHYAKCSKICRSNLYDEPFDMESVPKVCRDKMLESDLIQEDESKHVSGVPSKDKHDKPTRESMLKSGARKRFSSKASLKSIPYDEMRQKEKFKYKTLGKSYGEESERESEKRISKSKDNVQLPAVNLINDAPKTEDNIETDYIPKKVDEENSKVESVHLLEKRNQSLQDNERNRPSYDDVTKKSIPIRDSIAVDHDFQRYSLKPEANLRKSDHSIKSIEKLPDIKSQDKLYLQISEEALVPDYRTSKLKSQQTSQHLPDINIRSSTTTESEIGENDINFKEMFETVSISPSELDEAPEQLVMIKQGGFCKIVKIGGSTKGKQDSDQIKQKGKGSKASKLAKSPKQVDEILDKFSDLNVQIDGKLYTSPEKTEYESEESRVLYTISEKTEPESEFQEYGENLIRTDETSELRSETYDEMSGLKSEVLYEFAGEFESDKSSLGMKSEISDEQHTLFDEGLQGFDEYEEEIISDEAFKQIVEDELGKETGEQIICDEAFKHTVEDELCKETGKSVQISCTDITKDVKKPCRDLGLSPSEARILSTEQNACTQITELINQRILDYQCGRFVRKSKRSSKKPETTDEISQHKSTDIRSGRRSSKICNHGHEETVYDRTSQIVASCDCRFHDTVEKSQHLRPSSTLGYDALGDHYVRQTSTYDHQQDCHHTHESQDKSAAFLSTCGCQKDLEIREATKHVTCSQHKKMLSCDCSVRKPAESQPVEEQGWYSGTPKPGSCRICSSPHYDRDIASEDVYNNQDSIRNHGRVSTVQSKPCNTRTLPKKNTNDFSGSMYYKPDTISKHVKQFQFYGGLSHRRCKRGSTNHPTAYQFSEQLKHLEHEKCQRGVASKTHRSSKFESQEFGNETLRKNVHVCSEPTVNEEHIVCTCNIEQQMFDEPTQFRRSQSRPLRSSFYDLDLVTDQSPHICSLTMDHQAHSICGSTEIKKPICHDQCVATTSFQSDSRIELHDSLSYDAIPNQRLDERNKMSYDSISDNTESATLSQEVSNANEQCDGNEVISVGSNGLNDNELTGGEEFSSFYETTNVIEMNTENEENFKRGSLKNTDKDSRTSRSKSTQSASASRKSLGRESQILEKTLKDSDEWFQVETERGHRPRRKVCQETERTYSVAKTERQVISASDLIEKNKMVLKICGFRQSNVVPDPCRKYDEVKKCKAETPKVCSEEKPKPIRCEKLLITPPVRIKKHPEGFCEIATIELKTQSTYGDLFDKLPADTVLDDIKYKRNYKSLKSIDSVLARNMKQSLVPRIKEKHGPICHDTKDSFTDIQKRCDKDKKSKPTSKDAYELCNKTGDMSLQKFSDKSKDSIRVSNKTNEMLHKSKDSKAHETSAGDILKPVPERISEKRIEHFLQNVREYEKQNYEENDEFELLEEEISDKDQNYRSPKPGSLIQKNGQVVKEDILLLDQTKYDKRQKQSNVIVEPDQHNQQIRQSQMYDQYRRRRIKEDRKHAYNKISQEEKTDWMFEQIQVTPLEIKEADQTSEQIKHHQSYEQFKRDRLSEKMLQAKQRMCDRSRKPSKKASHRPFLHV